jgi:hypothetical protein
LLAILVLLLTAPEELRGTHLILFEDNLAALSNVLAGAAGDADSRELVGAVWLVAAALQLTLWIEYVPSESNPADAFSRPDEPEKQQEAAALGKSLKLRAVEPRLPSSIHVTPGHWATALKAATQTTRSRAEQAKLAASLGVAATDDHTLRTLLGKVQFSASSGEVTLGWVKLRRHGLVGAATGCHAGLAKVLCAAFKQRHPGLMCSTIVLAQDREPRWPAGAFHKPAMLLVSPQAVSWVDPKMSSPGKPLVGTAVVFYSLEIDGIRERTAAAPLIRYGFPL